MTKELLSELINGLVNGTIFGICFSFWIMILAAVWRWFLGVIKRFLHWLFPKSKWFQPKSSEAEKN